MISAHTYYSLRYGCLSPKESVSQALDMGWKHLIHADINNNSASIDMLRYAKKEGIKVLPGVDFRNSAFPCYTCIAKNNTGFKEINDFLSGHIHEKRKFSSSAPSFKNVIVVYPFSKNRELRVLAEYEFIGVDPNDIDRLKFSPWLKFPDKLLAFRQASFRNKKDFNSHRLLRAIDNNTLLSKLSKEEEASPSDFWIHRKDFEDAFKEFPHLIENGEKQISQCQFNSLLEEGNKNPRSYTASADEDWTLIQKLCKEGLSYRYPIVNEKILNRIQKELHIIREKGFLSYFLINWDITSYAREKGYFYVGRGSGANSVVAYLLRITDVDPIDLDLYFERFINLYRQNPPDFDIDFSWLDRDDVTRYIFKRFKHVALLAVYNTFQYKAVVRELGKVFGLPKYEIDKLSKGNFNIHQLDHVSQLVLRYSSYIQGFPNHLSVHAGGILISEKSIHNYCGTFLPPKGFPTSMFDMVVAEDIGLYKFDILSQRGLGKIKDALEIIAYNQPEKECLDIHNIAQLKKDEKIKDILRNANAIGCFYVESPAMRMLLKKLQVDHYLGLVAASSVIRPGVAKSGMMREYILRYRYPEKRKEAHPILQDIMPETFGVMVYQEDVIKVAHYFAGLSLAEADVLRRGMSGKFRSRDEFEKARISFFKKAAEKGHPPELVKEIWRQTESFAGYAFAKGHSASYAVESYQSLYLKAYFPLEYMVATINNFGGFYRTELYVREAQKHGATIYPPCINRSGIESRIYDRDIYLGLGLIKSLEHETIKNILRERENGPYKSLVDFCERVSCSIEQCVLLIRSNAFAFSNEEKKNLLWRAHLLLGHKVKAMYEKNLFQTETKNYKLPELYKHSKEESFDQIELLGFPLGNPFELLEKHQLNSHLAEDLPSKINERVSVLAYLITIKKTKTSNGKLMYFGTFLDQKGEWIDTVHFPPIAQHYPFRGGGVYRISGKVICEFECISIEVEHMHKCDMIVDPRYDDSSKATQLRAQRTNNNRVHKESA